MRKPNFSAHSNLPVASSAISRRMFLQGLGASLAIPFLPSLSYGQAAAGSDVYYIFTNVSHGRLESAWNPSKTSMTTVGTNVKSQKLSAIAGGLGYIIGNRFDDIRDKLSIIQGLDALAGSDHYWFPWSASTVSAENGDKLTPYFPWSIDSVLAQSKLIYPGNPAIPVLRMDPKEALHTYSWAGKSSKGTAIRNGATGATVKDTWAYVSKALAPTTSTTGVVDPAPARKKLLVDRFLSQSKSVMNSRQISADDKSLLQNFIDQLNDVEKKISTAPAPASALACTPPSLTEPTDNIAFNHALIDIMTLAMACGLTRIGMYHLNWAAAMSPTENLGDRYFPNVHDDIHNFNNGGNAYKNMKTWWGNALDHYGYMVRKMDSYGLLQKAAIVFTSDFSSSTAGHHGVDLPVICAGGLNGKLVQGELISFYRQQLKSTVSGQLEGSGQYTNVPRYGGRRYNEFLISLMAAGGLTAADYQREGTPGFGTYDSCFPNSAPGYCVGSEGVNVEALNYYLSYQESRTATLPYFYKG